MICAILAKIIILFSTLNAFRKSSHSLRIDIARSTDIHNLALSLHMREQWRLFRFVWDFLRTLLIVRQIILRFYCSPYQSFNAPRDWLPILLRNAFRIRYAPEKFIAHTARFNLEFYCTCTGGNYFENNALSTWIIVLFAVFFRGLFFSRSFRSLSRRKAKVYNTLAGARALRWRKNKEDMPE